MSMLLINVFSLIQEPCIPERAMYAEHWGGGGGIKQDKGVGANGIMIEIEDRDMISRTV